MNALLSEPVNTAAPGGSAFDALQAADRLAEALAATAVERDRQGGHAAAERELIRGSGLLTLLVPRAHGGLEADWPTLYRTVRRIAEADSALAHVYAFHHLQITSVLLYGNAQQQDRLLTQTVSERLFWGNALNPLDPRLVATRAEGGWTLDGVKSYASGSVGSDRLVVSAHVTRGNGEAPLLLVATLPTRTPGITVVEDWDSFGQRQTDSGTVRFEKVFLPEADVLIAPGAQPTPRASLRTLVSQLILTNLYAGIARGAFEAARRFTMEEARPWQFSGVSKAADDPYAQQHYAELWLKLRPALAIADAAAEDVQSAFERGEALTAEERGTLAITIAEAKVLAHRAAIEISSQLFELTGARSTSSRYGFDRFWRNARVHTLHDPVDYKLRDIGRHLLGGRIPEPTSYS